ncbi:tyrosine-type recombinase/integrase [Streptomyces sp. NPDC058525]|uniref:tyrosine-type recombinase/integrase n=1 Tax=Streptomyces sp. NPDC058525 TaxID=3346538 RepID=UPI003652683B
MGKAHVSDRWHKSHPKPGEKVCREHRRVPTAAHGDGMRWEVRGRDAEGVALPKQRFVDKTAAEEEAAKITNDITQKSYVSPRDSAMLVRDWAAQWLANQPGDEATGDNREQRIRLHIVPGMGELELGEVERRPSLVQRFLKELEDKQLSATYRLNIFTTLNAMFSAAVEDQMIKRNPCLSSSVTKPKAVKRKLVPWTLPRVMAVVAGLADRYRAMGWVGFGAGLRQGEVFGLAVDDVDFAKGMIHVRQQVKFLRNGTLIFAPPKGGKTRDVPMDSALGHKILGHMALYPPVLVTLPWVSSKGKPRSFRLLFTREDGQAHQRPKFNTQVWKPALVAGGVIPAKERGDKRHASSPEDGMHALRHAYASALIEGGCSIKELASFLGHSSESFTLETYVHLMPKSDERARSAIGAAMAQVIPLDERRPSQMTEEQFLQYRSARRGAATEAVQAAEENDLLPFLAPAIGDREEVTCTELLRSLVALEPAFTEWNIRRLGWRLGGLGIARHKRMRGHVVRRVDVIETLVTQATGAGAMLPAQQSPTSNPVSLTA